MNMSREEFLRRFPDEAHQLERNQKAQDAVIQQTLNTPAKKRIRQSAKPLMNKLETDFFLYIMRHLPDAKIRAQAKRYKLANGLWYKPDFIAQVHGRETAWEVKGPHAFRGGFENLKMAAHEWPEVKFILAWKEGGSWNTQDVLP